MVFLTRSIHLQLARAKFQAQRRSGIQEYKILQQRFKKKKKVHPEDLGLTVSIYC